MAGWEFGNGRVNLKWDCGTSQGPEHGLGWPFVLILDESNALEELPAKEGHALILTARSFPWDQRAMEKLR